MARVVIKKANQPEVVKKDSHICMCGLSENQPYCDGSHNKTLDEGKDTYYYAAHGRLKVEEIKTTGHVCACGDDGACDGCTHK